MKNGGTSDPSEPFSILHYAFSIFMKGLLMTESRLPGRTLVWAPTNAAYQAYLTWHVRTTREHPGLVARLRDAEQASGLDPDTTRIVDCHDSMPHAAWFALRAARFVIEQWAGPDGPGEAPAPSPEAPPHDFAGLAQLMLLSRPLQDILAELTHYEEDYGEALRPCEQTGLRATILALAMTLADLHNRPASDERSDHGAAQEAQAPRA